MKSHRRLRSLVAYLPMFGVVFALAACGSAESTTSSQKPPPSGTTTPPGTPPPTDPPPTQPPPMPPPAMPPATSDWKTLLAGDWTMPPGREGYVCVRKTIDEDLFVTVLDAINPRGTHHTLLTMGQPDGTPDGIGPCNAGSNFTHSVFGSGVGSVPLAFPPGVALRIKKGTQLLLNLHLFNTGQADIAGTSGTRVKTVAESDAPIVAEGLLAGTTRVDLPPAQMTTTIGHCTMSTDATIFAVSPHMHVLGVHEKIVAERAGLAEIVLHDAPYDFEEQKYFSVDPIPMKKGDRVRVECTHHNTTAQRVTFGESTLQEMCFAGLYRYPADGSPFTCIR